MNVYYGRVVISNEQCVKIITEPQTWRGRIRVLMDEAKQALLFAVSVTCFMYALGMFR
jgi:hypothetical protein